VNKKAVAINIAAIKLRVFIAVLLLVDVS